MLVENKRGNRRGFLFCSQLAFHPEITFYPVSKSSQLNQSIVIGGPQEKENMQNKLREISEREKKIIGRKWGSKVSRGRDRGQGSGSRAQAGGKGEIQKTEKKLLQKNGVISEGSIFSNKCSKNKINNKNKIRIQFFYRIFIKNFPTICVFRPNARKINSEFVHFCGKQAFLHFS